MKSAMQNGLILGVIFSVNFLFLALNFQSLILFGILIILFTTYKITVRFRDNQNDGQITYKKAYNYIVLLFFFAAIISSIVKYIYTQFIDTTLLNKILLIEISNLKAMSRFTMPESYYDFLGKIFKPAAFALESILENFLRGVLVALIMAAFIKKEKNIFNQQ